ncbi:peroxisomal acyl-coenzyme A oxidase 2 [Crotalus tigris]|uniref:peroxisomal acyl-coenzyme A oxidase 2 n=1 Tax=Crotalus tigris TaxID=88082 RepID=UPI00192FB47A|nr:peroxisomal acyl-coenzyme A oxidase 2 [Crotalus tigris]XP_039182539.1 peroxisomal acyl-coenzyme A oxidase 2 [Crotalus tigris]
MEAKKANIVSPNSPRQNVNPDLDIERKNISFSIEHLTNILDGGSNNTKLRREVEAVLEADPEFSPENRYFQSQNERYETAIRKSVYLSQKMAKMGWIADSREQYYCFKFLAEDLAFNIHIVFIKSILALGTDEQINKWIPLANKNFIIGTYAQTELGHGSNLRGLESTATFDVATQEFILNTPSVSSMKWWPGDLGRTATHAVFFAQLYLKGHCYGMHPFIVQIRSLRDHSPGQGITLGDIGPKMGFENIDNGFLILKNVRVPRENMLAKFSQVLPDGQYKKQGSDKINYLTMIVVRVNMLQGTVIPCLMKACTIAIRYSVVRRQSELKPGEPEAKVLDYQTQQQKLFPQLATAYAFHFVCNYLLGIFKRCYIQTNEGKFDLLPELHALAAGIKVITTNYCSEGVEVCRKACGGHGYSLLSGLPSLYMKVIPSCTYEGENTVLLLQTARFLIKCYGMAQMSQPLPSSVAYFSSVNSGRCQAQEKKDFLNPDIYTDAYKHRAFRGVRNVANKLRQLVEEGKGQHEAWNQCTVQLAKAAMAHSHYIVVQKFTEELGKHAKGSAIQRVLKNLCDLFALHGIFSNAGDFMQDAYFSTEQIDRVTETYLDLLAVIRKDAVPLVDAFDFSDACLNSALGSYDGHAYQRLYEWAKKSPTNQQDDRVFKTYLKPLFQNALSKL